MHPTTLKSHDELIARLRGNDKRLLVGITGGIASGKSTVSRMLVELGALLIDFDLIARQVVEPGKPALKMIVDYFGEEVLKENGALDRKKLSDIVFRNPEKREMLESLTHPPIYEEFFRQVDTTAQKHPDAIIQIVVPLMIEGNVQYLFEIVVIVYVTREKQIERLAKRDGISAEEAANMLKSQFPLDEKVNYADYVINNSGTIDETRRQVEKLWEELIKVQGSR